MQMQHRLLIEAVVWISDQRHFTKVDRSLKMYLYRLVKSVTRIVF